MTKSIEWHEENLETFRTASNGNRNDMLNTQAMASFQLALGSDELSVTTVESDYSAAAAALGLNPKEIKATLRSAFEGAKLKPRQINYNGHLQDRPTEVTKEDMIIAPTFTALDDYAKAHGVSGQVFLDAKWSEGTHMNRQCLLVRHEDGITRVRFLDGEEPKWIPIKPSDMKNKITPCWYGFNRAVVMAKEATHKTIVLCNGQPSVVVGQYFGIPALAQTDGEGKKIQPKLMKRLLAAIKEHDLKIVLAYDGDEAGRKANNDIAEQLRVNGVTPLVANFGGDDHFDLADYCAMHKVKAMEKLLALAQFSKRKVDTVVCGNELAIEFREMIKFPSSTLPTGELIVTPMEQLHRLGGMAMMLQPGLMTEVMGPSGGGKTTFMETWVDSLRRSGYHVLWYSPEWIPMTMHLRTIQRYGGANADEMWLNVLWYKEQAEGIPEPARKGKKLSPASEAGKESLRVNDMILNKWAGDIHCFTGKSVTESILEDMSKRLYLLRRHGVKVGVAFFDYAQLLHTVVEEKGRNSYEIIVGMIKRWSAENHIHSVVGSQVTKERARLCLEQKRYLGKYDSNWVAPNEFNLIMTLNIVYNGKDAYGEPIKTNKAVVNVCKNNMGQEGIIRMRTDFQHLQWLDETWQ